MGGEILAETDGSGNTTAEYVFFGGKRVAMLPAGSTPIYYVEDLLGTSRVTTTNTGVVCYDADFYPYGGERSYTNTCPQNYKFEGKERDTETGNDDFGARYYSNRFGRWLSADWSSVPGPVPYANLTNPQTLNLYSMVADDPESFADLDGWDVAWGVLNSIASNFVSTQRVENGNSDVKTGQALGDALSVTVGTAVAITTVAGSVALDAATDGAALVLTPAETMVATTAANGALQGGKNLLKSSYEKSSTDSNTTEKKPHGNTAGDQPADLYELHDANGNFEKHGVSQDANKRYSQKELNGGKAKVVERGPRKEMLKKERQKVETNPGPKNKEPWAGKQKDPNQKP